MDDSPPPAAASADMPVALRAYEYLVEAASRKKLVLPAGLFGSLQTASLTRPRDLQVPNAFAVSGGAPRPGRDA
jgi:hypothetical protein